MFVWRGERKDKMTVKNIIKMSKVNREREIDSDTGIK